jgi:osmotically-inducible protein OsmY
MMMQTTTTRTTLALALLMAVACGLPASSAIAGERCPTAAVGEFAADRRATAEVRRRIAADETMSESARQVEVTTQGGVVTLRGPVETAEERTTLASLAESVPGVRRVEERLQVRR